MVTIEYDPVEDTVTIIIDAESETVDFKELMDGIPHNTARKEYLLSMINDVKEARILKTAEFMKTIEDIMDKQIKVRQAMEDAANDGDHKMVRSLQMVHKALLDEKNTIREIRYAIKLTNDDEGALMAELMDLLE